MREKKTASLDLAAMAAQATQEVEKAKEPQVMPVESAREELTPREISFTLAYDAPDGKDLSTELVSKVLNADGRSAKARVYAQLTRGLNVEQASPEDRYRMDALSRIAVQLVEPPTWLVDAVGEDLELLVHVNNILVEHETRYFRSNARQGEAGKIESRVRSSVPAFEKKADA